MALFAALLAALYAVVNAFGAWSVSRRKPWVARLFMVAALVLTVAAAALITDIPYTRALLAVGLVLASLSSYLNAQVVLGRVVWRDHAVRALAALALYLLAGRAL